jgi:hypothetical protein
VIYRKRCVVHKYATIERVATLPTNTYFIHGTVDTVIPYQHTQRLFAAMTDKSCSSFGKTDYFGGDRTTIKQCTKHANKGKDEQTVMSVVVEGGHHDLMFAHAAWYPTLAQFVSACEASSHSASSSTCSAADTGTGECA